MGKSVEELIHDLHDEDAGARMAAREELVAIGGREVVMAVIPVLHDPDKRPRWEAAKVLKKVPHEVAAPALLNALEDCETEVRWAAGEAMLALGVPGIVAILNGLIRRGGSPEFQQAAHHVLRDLKPTLDDPEAIAHVDKLLASLDSSNAAMAGPVAALAALQALKAARRRQGLS